MSSWLVWTLLACLCAESLQWSFSTNEKYKSFLRYDRQLSTSEVIEVNLGSVHFQETTCRADNDGFEDPSKITTSTECKPRTVVVPILSPLKMHQSQHLYPSHVEVNRCSGSCSANPLAITTCTPALQQTIEIPVTAMMWKMPSLTSETKCFIARVENHTSCNCRCTVQERHCIPNKQKYDPIRCRCECTDVKLQARCEKRGKKWNPVNCTCDCNEVRNCTTGSSFDPETCKCTVFKKDKKSDMNKYQKLIALSKLKSSKKRQKKKRQFFE